MQNTAAAKEKRQDQYIERGYWEMPLFADVQEPYITWEQLVSAMLAAEATGTQIHQALENNLQLFEAARIFNSRKESR